MKKILIISLLIISIADISISGDQPTQPVLRVAVLNNSPSVKLSIKGPYEIKTLQKEELIESGSFLKSTDVFPTPEGIEIGKKPYKFFGVKIEPGKDAFILINDRIYRGEIDIIRTKDARLLLVNHVGLEDYLYGVLYHEVSPRWPIEALKAQAIVSRTYALYQKSINETRDFDLTSDFYSQVYGGKTSEKYRTTRAVDLTRGEVLIYEGKLLPAYFHATCGGHTEDAGELWNTDLVPLKGVKCNFCRLSPHYRWENSLNLKEVMEKLVLGG
ncbi:MAG: SpoIID/LytB domain-containing protein, partial [Candidatus Omnitrophica bacterium]|nr:SpoIID/LytB domain-containing protein [Candidatus Omnitrophota bacterium]